MTEMTTAEKIQIAADIICDEMHKIGVPIPRETCLVLASRIYVAWKTHHEIRQVPAGEVAHKFRARESYTLEELNKTEPPK